MTTYFAQFNNFYLKSDSYHLTKIDMGSPKNKNSVFELARADGQITTNQNFGERKIKITGSIKAKDLNDMITKLDTLKANLVGYDKNLDIYLDDKQRRFIATVDSFTYETQGYYCEYEINFTANSYGTDLVNSALVFGTYTSSNTTYTNNIEGSFKSKAYMDLRFSYVAPYWSSAYLQINNAAENQRIRITRIWGWYDRVVLDGANKTVQIYPTTKTVLDECDSITGWTSGNTLSLTTTTGEYLESTGAFKVVMAAAATSSYVQRLNATAVDLSSTTGKVILPVFIPTPTSGTVSTVRLQAGSDATLASNYVYWDKTTQWNGSAIATNAWNYFEFDMATTPDNTTGTPTRSAIKSIQISLRSGANFQLNGWRVDYITLQKQGITPIAQDYEGQFPDLNLGSCSLVFTDEFTNRNIVATGSYYKRYI
jgi:predicted phage tail component-like protein